ncbi:MAG: hypothetical protein AABY13_02465 [Nanoarchaeota archaeon]|mgnify:FL=1
MATMTLAVPDDLKQDMEEHADINWSEVARSAFKKRLTFIKFFKEFTKDSELTEEDAIELGRKVRKSLNQRYLKALKA